MATVLRMLAMPGLALAAAGPALFLFVPVCIGTGIALWFALTDEPGRAAYAAAVLCGAGGTALALTRAEAARPLALAVACASAGFLAAGLRAHSVAAPVLAAPYDGPVQGRLVAVDRSASDALRVTLDRVTLSGLAPAVTPRRVRVSLQGPGPWPLPQPGAVVAVTARLSAPDGPVEPDGFDFRRLAFFDGLGAVGYTRTPLVMLDPPRGGALTIARTRLLLSRGIRSAIPGDAGAFAAGVMTGDRSGLGLAAVQALRDSNLAHILAISGMHMAFLVSFVFVGVRTGLALVPVVGLRLNAKKVAAVVALGVAAFYLALSGANVSTQRAFVMVAVMLGAVLTDRRALTLRSVAIAATILLLWQPESLLEPGFQMSFAATVALITGFRAVDLRVWRGRLPRLALPVFTLVLSSVLGGFATAPYAAAHFNRFADYGLVANLLTVPVMGAVVMPGGAVAALLAPVGLAEPALWVQGLGAGWILQVAHTVAGWQGAVTAIPAPPAATLGIFTLGAIWLVAWPFRTRMAGLIPVAVALAIWPLADRPDLLISGDGRLLGLLGPEGRALSAARGGGFAAKGWLENDGDLASQAQAAGRPGFDGPAGARRFVLGGVAGVALSGDGAPAAAAGACAAGLVVVLAGVADPRPAGCLLIDLTDLRAGGPIAIDARADGTLRIRATRDRRRIWTGPADPMPVRLMPPAALRLAQP